VRYPEARRLDLVETIHGQPVADPYRWLEEATAETDRWSVAQDELARQWLDARPGRDEMRTRLERLIAAGLVDPPLPAGDRLFFLRRAPDQEHAVLLVREPDGTERVLVDPAALSPDGTITLDFWKPSLEGDLLAYGLSEGGDEEAVLRVMDVATGTLVDGPIDRTRYSPLAWCPGGRAFYYGRRLPPDVVPAGEEKFHRRIWRHEVGRPAATDEMVFGDGREKTEYHTLDLSTDGRWLVIGAAAGTAPRNDLYVLDVTGELDLAAVQEQVDCETYGTVVANHLYLLTSDGAPHKRVVVTDPATPGAASWRELVAETDRVLDGFVVSNGALVVAGTQWAVASVTHHDATTGALIADIPLPGAGTVTALTAHRTGGDDVWIGYTDFVTPPEVHHWSLSRRALTRWERAPGDVNAKGINARQVWFASVDGTHVPMFLLTAEDAVAGTPRPTILTGYGGFNLPMQPGYVAGALAWLESGGSYAIVNLRGGGEGGEAWHRAGRRERKQNVFDDFACAARWLASEGWTTPAQLSISGGSNGGLLVGAALTQHPDLFASVVCSAPLLDMVRYERFGLGQTWNDEYGTADDAEEFGWLLSYSPYHHVVDGTAYPAVLFTVFESDTRVDPVHARKLCAALQHATTSDPEQRPILLRRERNVGHGPRSVSRTVDLSVDTLTFQAAQLGLNLTP